MEYGKVFMVRQIQTMLSDGDSLNSFTPTTVEETERLIVTVDKHCLLDPVPTALIKNCATLLAPFLLQLFNRSLFRATFQLRRNSQSSTHY